MREKISVIGLGYVGLPVALAFARKFPHTVGFDIHCGRVDELKRGHDRNGETPEPELRGSSLEFTCDTQMLDGTTFFVVAVPTPVDENNVPDLTPLAKASEFVGKHVKPGAIVCFESTVYPGATEEICGPILEKVSGLVRGKDFTLAYSPERINPGDTVHTLQTVTKVVSGEDDATLERVAAVYGAIVPAGVHKASSIKVAEAAKVIENTQRDINIALMNELSVIFDRLGIRTIDVLAAAGTKWNFLPFRPGLVGGHCIGVDPYYLTMKAQQVGYQPEVILAGRRINNGMGPFIGQKMAKLLIENDIPVKRARVGILGLTFKEDVNDLRNSKVPDILKELADFGIDAVVHDPHADAAEALHEYGIKLAKWEDIRNLDGLVVAVAHEAYTKMGQEKLLSLVRHGGVVMDVKSVLDPKEVDRGIRYWSL
ncbi:UDP-glucose dehydrogenase [Labilithrix luteola]|uniref:UDP-glucose dehydrogenase n=1 Tax=Labilithrix luteola TaxID=1391654 RepID=A0A0K1Q6C9_9BACT|nr:nucleotide sugar dehydrogenase [Labilithrix luteola]AKV00970.1 UDP-glucose dehydrogenase [Labilithrix luteola]